MLLTSEKYLVDKISLNKMDYSKKTKNIDNQ